MKYDKYKASGIDWIGDVPNHWSIKRIKDYATVYSGSSITNSELLDEGYEVYGGNGFMGYTNKYNVKDESIIIGRVGAKCGNVKLITEKKWISDNALILKKIKRNDTYRYVAMILDRMNLGSLSTSTAQPLVTGTKVLNQFILFPSLEEQNQIAQYLDIKTLAIDKKANLLTQKINYYKELRKSIINDSVCTGLDKNVTLKESEFAFSINDNWKTYRLKDLGFLYSGLSGKAGDDFNQDDNPNNKGFIPFTNISNNTYLKVNHLGTVVVYENEKQNKVRKGDLFFLMSSEGYDDVGKTAALAEDIPDTYLNSFCKGYRITKKNCEPYFLNYLLLSDNYRKSLMTEGKGFTRINLKMEKVTDFFVYLPPTKEEQIAIAAYLDEKTQKIDAIVNNIGKQIEILKELRKTLINDVVTGKIKVTL